jgi:hypothetical protein
MRSCLGDEDVKAFFEGSRFKKSVYMIVRLKIAKGAKVSKGLERNRETTAKMTVDGTGAGVPVKAGPEVEVKGEKKESTEWRDEKSFVFAYRLRKITCKKGEIVEEVEFNRGAFLDLESSRSEKGGKELHYFVEDKDADLEGNVGEKISEDEDGEEEVFMWPVK